MTYDPDYSGSGAGFYHFAQGERETASDRAWDAWTRKTAKLLGLDSLDGDEARDGYSLDFAYDAYANGETPERYAEEIRERLGAGVGP